WPSASCSASIGPDRLRLHRPRARHRARPLRELIMSDVAAGQLPARTPVPQTTAWDRLRTNRQWLGLWFMLPAAGFLFLFLAYPLGLGIWMSFTDTRIGRTGTFIGLENY